MSRVCDATLAHGRSSDLLCRHTAEPRGCNRQEGCAGGGSRSACGKHPLLLPVLLQGSACKY